jgi:hypothetical protein
MGGEGGYRGTGVIEEKGKIVKDQKDLEKSLFRKQILV